MKSTLRLFIAAAMGIMLLQSCSRKIDSSIVSTTAQVDIVGTNDTLNMRFLGTACLVLNYHGNSVLTDPFISNPPLRKLLFGKVYSDTAIIRDFITEKELSEVSTVVVGHCHYDHLLDLPFLKNFIQADAQVIGSPTAHHLLASAGLPQSFVDANSFAATNEQEGRWIYSNDKSIRVMPVKSEHPPHFLGITLYGGCYNRDLKTVPRKSRKWKMGEPLAYLIDFMKPGGQIATRIWFQSSASEYPLGFFPESLLNEHKVDIALLSVATGARYEHYPDRILNFLKPEAVVMIHWENLWRNKYKSLKTVQNGNPEKLYEHLRKSGKKTPIILPKPGAKFSVF